jgi:linoleoyl-CoA desaturase
MIASINKEPIYKTLKECVNRYFEDNGISRYADRVFWIKAVFYILVTISGYFMLLAFGATSLFIVFGCYLLFNVGSTLFVVNVAHDATHQCLSGNKSANHIMSYSWNVMGISKYLWEIQHHRSHHNFTGIPDRDVDIAETPWVRYSPTHPYRSHFRYQHLYAPFLYLLFGIFVVYIKDFVMLFSDKLKNYGIHKLPRYFLARLIGTKLLYIFAGFIIPAWILPYAWWEILIIYLVTLSISSGSMLIVLVMPHINEHAVSYETDVRIKNQDDWALHQLQANIDSSANSQWLSWLLGGLNTHLVHHLFPNISHIHYRQLTRVIRQTLSEQGIHYKERSFVSGVTDHFKFLKQMGIKPAESGEISHSSSLLSNTL